MQGILERSAGATFQGRAAVALRRLQFPQMSLDRGGQAGQIIAALEHGDDAAGTAARSQVTNRAGHGRVGRGAQPTRTTSGPSRRP